jgi:uncharacterized repeat protein (TIGR02543 family)
MYWADGTQDPNAVEWTDASTGAIFDYSLWEPGYTEVRHIKIANEGSLALMYQLQIVANGEVSQLADVIDVYYMDPAQQVADRSKLSAEHKLSNLTTALDAMAQTANGDLSAGEDVTITIALKMREEAGNEYQNLDIGSSFSIVLMATQFTEESDSFGPDYDAGASFEFPDTSLNDSTSAGVTADDQNKVAEEVNLQGTQSSAHVPTGVQLEEGAEKLKLTVSSMKTSGANLTLDANEQSRSLDVHIDGISGDNTVPMEITIKEAMPTGLNMGNYKLYHVENGSTVEMTMVDTFTAHNQFKYDPATGDITLYMATFSEVALVADTENAWEGNFDYSWYLGRTNEYTIANADQLAAFGAIVGGMAEGIEQDSFSGKTVNLISDVNLGDDEENNNSDIIFYPIGYNSSDGKYEKTGVAVTTGFYNFCGTFDGNGHTVSNFYQNTWEMKGDNNYYDATLQYYRDGMGLFGRVYRATIKNLTVDNFKSDGEYTTTGVIAAYADGATFENIAIINCNPRVYNIGNGGIVGCVGWYAKEANLKTTFKNITVDNSNVISALWGSYDVACGGIVGQYYPTSGQSSAGTPANGGISFDNCHISSQMDVYNDVCGNYQYYAYRYAGMLIGSVRENVTIDGNVYPKMDGITAKDCTVHFGTWNDYYYCEFVKNGHPSYSGPDDYKFSRVPNDEIDTSNGKENATCIGHNHSDVEDNQAIYLPFNNLVTGYGWGVTTKVVGELEGVTILDRVIADSVEKFATKFTGDFLYRVGNQNTVSVGSLFAAKSGATIIDSGVVVTIDKVDENSTVSGTFTADTSDWTKGTIKFSGTGVVKVTIQDYNFCTPTVLYLEVVDAVNATGATSATSNNVVLLNDIGSGFTVSGRYAVYGNGFTLKYTGNGQYLNNGLKQGIVTVTENGKLDNLRIEASIYPASYLYYEEVQKGPSSTEGDKTRYHYQLSAVAASGNATISNCYIYGARNNIYVGNGNVTIKDTILENGTLSNVQIQSTSDYTVTFQNVTTLQSLVNATIGDTSKVMMGAGIVVGPETESNPKIVLNGNFKQYNWVSYADAEAVSNSTAKSIINTACGQTKFNHTVNGKTASNLGIIYLNSNSYEVINNTGLPYAGAEVTMVSEKGIVYSLYNAESDQIYSDTANVDKNTVNGVYEPQFKYSSDLGGQYIAKTDDGDEFCYREGDTIKVMFPSGDTKILDLAKLVSIEKYSGQDLGVTISCKNGQGENVDVKDNKVTLSNADAYVITYTVNDGEMEYSWNVTVDVSLKDTKIPNAYYEFDSSKQVIYRSGNSNIVQFIPFLAGLKIYDYNGQTAYLRFDGNSDFNKIAKASIENINTTGEAQGYHIVTVELTDGGKLVIDMDVRANSGSSTHSGSIKVRDNVLYVVNGGTTSGKGQTWKIYSYKFVGNNGTEINSGLVTFGTAGTDCSTASKPSSNFGTTVKYTLNYDANGGNCGQSIGYATSAAAAVTLPTPARSGYIFAGWYTAASGGTRVGGAGDSYTPSANITLYAQWGKPCNVYYNANGGTCDTVSAYYDGTTLTLPEATNGNKVLKGWYTEATDGERVGTAGDAYNPSAEITLYAQWQDPATVIYDANGGTCATSSATFEGTELTLPTPERTGYKFLGWYTSASGGTKFGDAGKTFIPSESVIYYAQWDRISYTITINKQSNATVTVDKTSAYYGDTISVTVTFSKDSSKSLTVKDASSNTILSKSAAGTYTFTMPASNVTIEASSSSCVTPDTLVTLADGTQKRIDQVTYADELLVWNFYTGEYTTAPSSIVMNHGYDNYTVTTLVFDDGTVVNTINGHGFFHQESRQFVILDEKNAADYIGHSFVKQDTGKTAKLVSYSVSEQYTESWSILTSEYYNCMLEGMLTLTPAEVENSPAFLMPYEIDEGMKYNAAKKQADINRFGLYTYEDFADYCTYEQFVALGLENFKVSVGKGYITWDEILYLLGIHG